MRIAVVGSGLAGLTTAWQLSQFGHDVTVFERRNHPALLAHTAGFTLDDRRYEIDTLVIWRTYHTALTSFLRELGLSLTVFPMHSVSFSLEGQPAPYARYQVIRLGFLGKNLLLPSGRSALETLEINTYWLRKWFRALRHRRQVEPHASIGGFFEEDSAERYRTMIYPWLCACFGFVSADMLRRTPLSSMLEFQNTTLPYPPQQIREGMSELVKRLLEQVEFRTEHEVASVNPTAGEIGGLRLAGTGPDGGFAESYDHVVLGVSPLTIGRLIGDLGDQERRIWSSFEECLVKLYVHTDDRLMPRERRDWSSVNYRLRDDVSGPVEETVWSNDVVEISGETQVFFSWNPIVRPAEDKILYTTNLIRVLPAVEVQDFLSREIPELQGQRNLWYCGTWAIPHRGSYLEEGVLSAREVARRLHETTQQQVDEAA